MRPCFYALARSGRGHTTRPAMTRPQIEVAIKFFVVLLIAFFIYALYRVGLQTGIIG